MAPTFGASFFHVSIVTDTPYVIRKGCDFRWLQKERPDLARNSPAYTLGSGLCLASLLPQSPRRRSDYRHSVVAMPLDNLVNGSLRDPKPLRHLSLGEILILDKPDHFPSVFVRWPVARSAPEGLPRAFAPAITLRTRSRRRSCSNSARDAMRFVMSLPWGEERSNVNPVCAIRERLHPASSLKVSIRPLERG